MTLNERVEQLKKKSTRTKHIANGEFIGPTYSIKPHTCSYYVDRKPACTIVFCITQSTDCMNSIKIYFYLALALSRSDVYTRAEKHARTIHGNAFGSGEITARVFFHVLIVYLFHYNLLTRSHIWIDYFWVSTHYLCKVHKIDSFCSIIGFSYVGCVWCLYPFSQ